MPRRLTVVRLWVAGTEATHGLTERVLGGLVWYMSCDFRQSWSSS